MKVNHILLLTIIIGVTFYTFLMSNFPSYNMILSSNSNNRVVVFSAIDNNTNVGFPKNDNNDNKNKNTASDDTSTDNVAFFREQINAKLRRSEMDKQSHPVPIQKDNSNNNDNTPKNVQIENNNTMILSSPLSSSQSRLHSVNTATTTKKQKLDAARPLYVEHIMKTGGTYLCFVLDPTADGKRTMNCRIHNDENFLFDPAINTAFANAYFQRNPQYHNLVFSESGMRYLLLDSFKDMKRFEIDVATITSATSATATATATATARMPFWETYTTVLLIRDPIERYISFYNQFCPELLRLGSSDLLPGDCRSKAGYNMHTVLYYQMNNFMTQHSVPDYRHAGTVMNCTQEVLIHAKSIIDKYDIVMSIKNASSVLGLASFFNRSMPTSKDTRRHRRAAREKTDKMSLSESQLQELVSKNRCDLELYKYAQMRKYVWH